MDDGEGKENMGVEIHPTVQRMQSYGGTLKPEFSEIEDRINLPGGVQPPGGEPEPGPEGVSPEQYEASLGRRFRRPELTEFAEQLTPDDIKEYSQNLVQVWLERYIKTGRQPNTWQLDQVAMSAASRMKLLRKLMERPGYRHSQEEEAAGLVSGVFWNDVSVGLAESFDEGEVEVKEINSRRYWVDTTTDTPIGLYRDNSAMNKMSEKLNLGKGFKPKIEIGRVVGTKEAKDRREKLADEIERQINYVEAWANVMEKVYEQDLFAGDLDNYVERQFLRIGKVIARSRSYREIFNAPSSREGLFAPFGEKVAVAYEAWREIADGRATMTFKVEGQDEPLTQTIPNMYAYAQNEGMRELCMKYVEMRVAQELPAGDRDRETGNLVGDVLALDEETGVAEREENRTAAEAGYVFMDHWDDDAVAAFDILRAANKDEVEKAIIEGALVDKFKLVWGTIRMYKEFFGEVPQRINQITPEDYRKNPRWMGPPTLFKVLPRQSGSFLEITTVNVLGTNTKTGEKKVIKVTGDQRVLGAKGEDGRRIFTHADGRELNENELKVLAEKRKIDRKTPRYTKVRQSKEAERKNTQDEVEEDSWIFEVTPLSDDKLWDTMSVHVVVKSRDEQGREHKELQLVPVTKVIENVVNVNVDENPTKERIKELQQDKMRVAMGTNTNAKEVPGGLLDWYALAIFHEFTRTDTYEQFKEYADSDRDYKKLKGLNKRFEVASVQLAAQAQLSEDTVEELEQFQRVALIAGVCASIMKNEQSARDEVPIAPEPEHQTTISNFKAPTRTDVNNKMLRAAFTARFVRTKSDEKGTRTWKNQKDRALFNYIIEHRNEGPFSPWDLYRRGARYFSKEQLKEMEELYSFLPEEEFKID